MRVSRSLSLQFENEFVCQNARINHRKNSYIDKAVLPMKAAPVRGCFSQSGGESVADPHHNTLHHKVTTQSAHRNMGATKNSRHLSRDLQLHAFINKHREISHPHTFHHPRRGIPSSSSLPPSKPFRTLNKSSVYKMPHRNHHVYAN